MHKSSCFIYYGAADTLVLPAMMEELFAACKVKMEKLIIEGAGHGDAMVTDREKCWDCVFNFLLRCALPGSFN